MSFAKGFVSVCLALASTASWAQTWPAKTIEITVPYPPGGSSDVMARLIGAKLQESLKQTVLVMNRPGASTIIGTTHVAKAAPDGYLLLLADNPFLVNATVMPTSSLSPISLSGSNRWKASPTSVALGPSVM